MLNSDTGDFAYAEDKNLQIGATKIKPRDLEEFIRARTNK